MSFDRGALPDWPTYADRQGLTIANGGRATWGTMSCPFHGGSDSLRTNLQGGGWVCMACGVHGGDTLSFHMQLHGLEFIDAARQLGAWNDDPVDHHDRPRLKPLPFRARDGLEVLAGEAVLVAVAACNLGRGVVLTEDDKTRLLEAAGRIQRIKDVIS